MSAGRVPSVPTAVNRRRTWLRRAAVTCGMLVTLWLVVCFLAVYALTRRSRSRFSETVPTVANLVVEDHRLRTADGEEIGIWYASTATRLPAVVLIHGNGGHRRACWPQAEILLQAGYSVVLISCRAHGDSTGRTNDIGWGARNDVVAAVQWLRQRRPQSKLILWGASLGAAAAVFAARDLQTEVSGYVLECPYRDLETAVRNRLRNHLPRPVDQVCYLGMRIAAKVFLPQLPDISPVKRIREIPLQVPILILAGGADRRALPSEAESLHAVVKTHSRLEIFADADHLQLCQSNPAAYERIVLEFLRSIR